MMVSYCVAGKIAKTVNVDVTVAPRNHFV